MATRVTIKKDLEARLRKKMDPLNPEDHFECIEEVLKLLDAERERVAAPKPASGLGYKELVALLRFELGDDLLVPPKPSTAYIVRLVNKLKDYGFDKEDIRRLGKCVRRGRFRPPYTLEWVIHNALSHLQPAVAPSDGGMVYTGRGAQDDEGGDDGI